MKLQWRDLGYPRADRADGKAVELAGFPLTGLPARTADHFLMMAEPGCCAGCVPANRLAVVEVFADQPLKVEAGQLRLTGTWLRRCNQMGIVVDVAHGTFELVKKAASVTTKPLVLSHTSLTDRPAAWTRRILPDHARAIAATGGVIGIWPVVGYFPNMVAYADGFARMVDVAGIDHVGLGTDLLGLVGASTLVNYNDLPQLAAALRGKFSPEETAKLLGGNYRRVFQASLGG